MNDEWRQLAGSALDEVTDGAIVRQSIVVEQYLPPDGSLRIQADAFARECIHTLYGQSLAEGLRRFGFNKGVACLGGDDAHRGGTIDVTYPGPVISNTRAVEAAAVAGERESTTHAPLPPGGMGILVSALGSDPRPGCPSPGRPTREKVRCYTPPADDLMP